VPTNKYEEGESQMNNLSKREKEKQTHEKTILNAAEKVFCTKGYEAAGMDEIAAAARFTKRTVYQYFENKEELYSAVVQRPLEKLLTKIRGISRLETTGYDKLVRFCVAYHQLYQENPQLVRHIEHWGRLKDNPTASGRYKEELIRTSREMTGDVADIIDEGKQDGSIQPDLDTEKTAICLKLMITGFYNQLSVNGEGLKSGDHKESEGLSAHVVELLITPLKRSKVVTATRKGTA
jgi:AcrR family transcriptional regulator